MIIIKNKRCKLENIRKEYPGAIIFDVTSKGALKTLSPFYPHGNIPVFGSDKEPKDGDPYLGSAEQRPFKYYSASVEGMWQGLKVFEHAGVDTSCFTNTTMRNLKRSCRRFGKCLGHMFWGKLIDYATARDSIYKPAYEYMLRWRCREEIDYLTYLNEHNKTIVLLDYNTNCDINNLSSPLSHASLIKEFVEIYGILPDDFVFSQEWVDKHSVK